MSSLNPKQIAALDALISTPEIQKPFFLKIKGLKWFDSLKEKGFFNAENNPKLEKTEQSYIHYKDWSILIYLEKTAPELQLPDNKKYMDEYLEVIRNVSLHEKDNVQANPRTWWYFSKLLNYISVNKLELTDAHHFKVWVSSLDNMLVGTELGENLLPRLLENKRSIQNGLAKAVLNLFLEVRWNQSRYDKNKKSPILILDNYWAEKVFNINAHLIGKQLGIDGAKLVEKTLVEVLNNENEDRYSYIWRPAIEKHEQNKKHENPPNLVISLFRDVLLNIRNDAEASKQYLKGLLCSECLTLRRLSIYVLGVEHVKYRELLSLVLKKEFFEKVALHHELFHFLNNTFEVLNDNDKDNALKLIQEANRGSKDSVADKRLQQQQKAYGLLRLLSAVEGKGYASADSLYQQQLGITVGNKPEHPDFHIYSSGGEWIGEKSPKSDQEILSQNHPEMVEFLISFEPEKGWNAPTKYGLSQALKQAILSQPDFFCGHIQSYLDVDLVYIAAIIEGYRELWKSKKDPSVKTIFPEVIYFVENLVNQSNFWERQAAKDESGFDVGIHWIVGDIAQTITTIVCDDKNAIDPSHNDHLLGIISLLLKHIEGADFEDWTDAVTLSINTARGKAVEALIDLGLRMCRLADQQENSHSGIWEEKLCKHFNNVLTNEGGLKNHEPYALFIHRWSNIRYLNESWAISTLPIIFDQNQITKWRVAIQGFSYLHSYDKLLYEFLRENDHLKLALNDDSLPDEVSKRIIQFTFIAYLRGDEDIEDNNHVLNGILSPPNIKLLSELIWFVWTLRDSLKASEQREKIIQLWQKILFVIGAHPKETRFQVISAI
jgi:hypothetical protein